MNDNLTVKNYENPTCKYVVKFGREKIMGPSRKIKNQWHE